MPLRRRILAATSLLTLALTAACSSGGADQTASEGATTGGSPEDTTIRVAGTGVSYPHSYQEGGELVGFETDVVREAAERAGYTVEFSTRDFPGLLPAVAAGRIDTTASNVTWTPERGETYVFSVAYAFDGVALVTREDSEVTEQAGLAGEIVSTGAGTTNEAAVRDWMETSGTQVDLRTYETADAALQELLVGRAEAIAGPQGATLARGEKQGVPLRQVGDLLTQEQTRLPFADTERGRQLAQDLSVSLREMREDGTIAELSTRYFGIDRSVQSSPEHDVPPADDLTVPEDAA